MNRKLTFVLLLVTAALSLFFISRPTMSPNIGTEPSLTYDTTINPVDGTNDFENSKNSFTTYFKSDPTEIKAISFKSGQSELSFHTLADQTFGSLSPSAPTSSGNTLTYADIYPSLDLIYSVSETRLLEEFVVQDKASALSITRISQEVVLQGVDNYAMGDGGVQFYQHEQLVFSLPRPILYEQLEHQNSNYGIKYEIKEVSQNTLIVTKVVTEEGLEWLSDPNRTYPIVIDLVIDNADTAGNWVSSNSSVLSSAQETTIKQEGTDSVKLSTPTWLSPSWSYRQKVTIDHTKVGGAAEVFDYGHEAGNLSSYTTTTTDGGDLSATVGSALNGSGYGVAAVIDDTTLLQARKDTTKSTKYHYRFYFDPNSIPMANNDRFRINHTIQDGGSFSAITELRLDYTTANGYRLVFDGSSDTVSGIIHDFATITDAPHYIEVAAVQATNSTSSDGSYEWWVDGVSQGSLTGIDNYNRMFDYNLRNYLKADEIDVGTTGTVYFDDFVLNSDGSYIGPVVTDFPVYVNLADMSSSFHSNVNQTDGRDIRVTKGDGTTELPREVVSYTAASDTGELHFKYTGTLSSSVNTDVYIYYGNSGASDYAVTDTYGRNNVWDSYYEAVLHFQETSGRHINSTGNTNYNTTAESVTSQGSVGGKMGGADSYTEASSNYLTFGNAPNHPTDNITVETWVQPTAVTEIQALVSDTGWGSNGYRMFLNGDDIYVDLGNGAMQRYVSDSTINNSSFQHIVFTFANPEVRTYVNASQIGDTDTLASSITQSTDTLFVGKTTSTNYYYDGIIDEYRFSSIARSSTWLTTQYNNQNSSSTFYSEGAEENAGGNRTIRFTAGTTQTVTGTWTVTGVSGSLVVLESTTTSAWTISPSAASVSYASISYSTNSGASICATYSTNGGNNTGWSIAGGGSCNTTPNSPTGLTQTSGSAIATGNWVSSTSITYSATATDTDNPDTLFLCIEKDVLGVGFSNTEDSCGSSGSYSGSGITLTHTISGQTDASEYHWQARVKDAAGTYSSWVVYGGNAESTRDYGLDTTAPTGGTVYDGTSALVDVTYATASLSQLSANWASINTDISGLTGYEYSIGTTVGGTDIKNWTSNTTSTSVTTTGLTLQSSMLYYVSVRTTDGAGNVSTPITSNGQLVSPSLTFTISPTILTFNNLTPLNSYSDDTKTTTLTTSTNAYNGYVVRGYVADYLRSTDGVSTIADFSSGSYATPATWSGSETGFGYTSSDTTIAGVNKFGTGTLYAPFSHVGPGDIVADHTSTVTGTPIVDEVFTLSYKIKSPSDQAAKNYRTSIIYTATAQY